MFSKKFKDFEPTLLKKYGKIWMIQSINYIVYVQLLYDIKGFVSNIKNVKTLLPRKSIKGKEYQFNSHIEPNVNLNTPS